MDLLHPALLAALDEGYTVLAPNRRAAQSLRLAYGETLLGRGKRAWVTPDVLTLGAWSERLWYSLRPTAQRILSARQCQVLWERIVAASPVSESLLSPASVAKAAARSWDLAQSYGIPLHAIAAEGGEEAGAFVEWATRFEAECHARGWLPPARILPGLARCTPAQPVRIQLALGRDPAPAEQALFRHLVALGGIVREEAVPADGRPQAFQAADGDHELQIAVRWAHDRLDAGCRSVALVVPSLATRRDAVRRALEDVFVPASRRAGHAARRVPFTIEASGMLTEFPLVRGALDLLELANGNAAGEVAGRLLRSPFVAGFGDEAPARALCDARLREGATEHVDVQSLERLAAASGCPVLAMRLAGMRRELPRSSLAAMASAWAERFLALWKAAGWPGDRTPDSDEQQTLAKLNESLSSFGALDDFLGPVSYGEALARFRQWAAATPFEPRTLPAPITVLDTESPGGVRFDAMWILGCDATRLPPAPEPDPFLPVVLQKQYGMPGVRAVDARRQSERAFAGLKGSAAQVVCSWAERVDDAEQSPSPFLDGLESLEETPALGRALAAWLQDCKPELARIVDRTAPPVSPGRTSGGARLVELQAGCAFRAQAELRLGARPLVQVSPGVDARQRGTLLHRALEELWGGFRDQRRLLAIPEDDLWRQVFATLDRHSVPLLEGASPHRARLLGIEVEIATRKICELLAIERNRQPFRVLERPEYAETYSAAGLTLDLKIDRIDILESGGEVVIDYKTGSSSKPSKWWGDRPEQPQLPLYAVARRAQLEAVAFALLNARDSGFSGVARRDDVLPDVREARGEWQAVLDDWQRAVDGLIGAYAAGDASVDPLPHACSRCHLAGLCRVHEAVGVDGLEAEEAS